MDSTQFYKELMKNQMKKNYKPIEDNVCLMIESSIVGTLGNFAVFSGLPKSGKGTFLAAAIASTFAKEDRIFEHRMRNYGGKIGYFDTENAESDFYQSIDRIKFIAKEKNLPTFFNAYKLRQYEPKDIRGMIEQYILIDKPKIVIIDGMLDIIDNFNDERESKFVINWLKTITETHQIFILGLIHLSRRENYTLGHFGSMLDRYAQSIIEIQRDVEANLYINRPKHLRSAKEYYKPFAIEWTGVEYVKTFYEELKGKKK